MRGNEGGDAFLSGQSWQERAFAYYDLLGEIKYASGFYSKMLAPLTLYAAERVIGATGLPEIRPTENEVAIRMLERIQDPGGGRVQLLSQYGRLAFLTGEALLFVSKGENDEEQWEMLSTFELRKVGSGPGTRYQRYRSPGGEPERYTEPSGDEFGPMGDNEAVAYRLWTKHPKFSDLSDSPMQAVLDVAEELLLLTFGVRARVRSRMAGAGFLLVPEELSRAPAEPAPDEDPVEDIFLKALTDAMMAPIQQEGSPLSVVPLVIRGPAEALDKLRHLQIHDPTQYYPETGLREEAIKRLAIGLDMPPEVLLGYANANHWSGWLISEQAWQSHGQPIAQGLVDSLSSSFYRPALKQEGVEGWENYLIAYDASAVVSHPNKAKDAKDLHDRGALSDKALRESADFDEDQAPSQEERTVWIAVHAKDTQLAMTGVPSTPGAAPPGEQLPPTDQSSEEVVKAPPEPAPNGNAQASARLHVAADLAVHQARQTAGNRIRSAAKKNTSVHLGLIGCDPHRVAAQLGRDEVRKLGLPPDRELVRGAHGIITDLLRRNGIRVTEQADRLAAQIEEHAARTLYETEPPPLPEGFLRYLEAAAAAEVAV